MQAGGHKEQDKAESFTLKRLLETMEKEPAINLIRARYILTVPLQNGKTSNRLASIGYKPRRSYIAV
jgi:hypothetical protein